MFLICVKYGPLYLVIKQGPVRQTGQFVMRGGILRLFFKMLRFNTQLPHLMTHLNTGSTGAPCTRILSPDSKHKRNAVQNPERHIFTLGLNNAMHGYLSGEIITYQTRRDDNAADSNQDALVGGFEHLAFNNTDAVSKQIPLIRQIHAASLGLIALLKDPS